MWKNRFQRKTGDEGNGAKGRKAQQSADGAATDLPSKEDRLALFRHLEFVVERRCRSYATLTDPRSLGVKAFFRGKNDPVVTSMGIRKRQLDYLRLHMLPTLAAALLLGIEDMNIHGEVSNDQNTKEIDSTTVSNESESSNETASEEPATDPPLELPKLTDPVACMTLLISNMVLVSKGNYDARVRHILKTACVPLLEEFIEEDEIEDHTEARTLYFLTEEHTKKEKATTSLLQKKEPTEDGIDEKKETEETPEPEMNRESTKRRIPKLTRSRLATQQFEAIERSIATDILKELVERDQAAMKHATKANTWKDHVVRGLQITTVGVVVGSLFAVTGGLAAPGLVAAITALGVHSTAVFAALTTTTALASMFGALGGGLGAYKMSKRVRGISEWRIRQETTTTQVSDSKGGDDAIHLRGLHSHVCVSGWLVEKCDFQRPFGVRCHDPPPPPLRSLQRFYCVHAPEKVKEAEALLKENEQEELWAQLKEEYGKTPDDLLPLEGEAPPILSQEWCADINNVLKDHVLPESAVGKMKETWEVNTMLIQMVAKNNELQGKASVLPDETDMDEEEIELVEVSQKADKSVAHSNNEETGESSNDVESYIQYTENVKVAKDDSESRNETARKDIASEKTQDTTEGDSIEVHVPTSASDDQRKAIPKSVDNTESDPAPSTSPTLDGEPSKFGGEDDEESPTIVGADAIDSGENDAPISQVTADDEKLIEELEEKAAKADEMNDHLEIIWDWQATYSGELYTLTWETDFLLKLCRVATVLFLEISDTIGKQILLNALVGSVVAIPSALWTASTVIDDPYQIISLRSKKAGIELARCLLTSDEHRPISLVGFSFGARLIFDCLLEIARHQVLWQEQQSQKENADENTESKKKGLGFIRRHRSLDDDKIDYVREPASIIEDVVLIGMPRILDHSEWITCREVVGGRLVNCFNRKDWIVSYMINVRCFNAVSKTCGTHEVDMEGVENFEVSEFASTHDRYLAAVPQILHKIGYSQPKPDAQS